MTWALRRRLFILLIVLLALGGVIFWYISPSLFVAPSCTDGVQNGTEVGIDCGGSCSTMCAFQVKTPTVIWARSFLVTDSVYNSVAYIENKNDGATEAIPYEFRLYDNNNVFISRIDGTALVPPLGKYAIVETGVQVGNAVVGHTTFEFSTTPVLWKTIPPAIHDVHIAVSNAALDTSSATPRLSATITNTSPVIALSNTVVAAILYDAHDNAINASRTVIPMLAGGASAPVFFTWPKAFSTPVVRYDILPIIDVFNAK